MRFNKSFWTVLMIITVSFVQAQTVKKPAKKPVTKSKVIAPDQLSNTLLWQISGNGLKQPSYLFGTMHALCADDAKLSESLKGVIRKTVKVYFEVDMDNLPEIMSATKYMRMNDGIKISDLLTKEEYAKLETFLKNSKSPMPISSINRLKPFLVAGLLSTVSLNCEMQDGMEQLIMKEASLHDKEIFGLESVQFQATLFDSVPYEKQAKDLIKYIDSADTYQKSTRDLVDVYLKQDLKRMDSLLRISEPGSEDYLDLLLYNRNRRWVFQMPGIMMEGTLLFAVGAGHLTGEQGVINLLRKKGFKVTPVANKWDVTRETTIEKKKA